MKAKPFLERAEKFIDRKTSETGCWLWTGGLTEFGYGQAYGGPALATIRSAHRLMYMHLVGEIPENLHLDHLCRVRRCVNPAHLEPVTAAENVRRGLCSYFNDVCHSGKHIIRGPEDVYKYGVASKCKQCQKDRQNRQRAERHAAGIRTIVPKTDYIGVLSDGTKWIASVRNAGKLHYLGRFDNPIAAAVCRDEFVKNATWKIHVKLNFPESAIV